jgi:2-polyprenyl-3-methyl-5-hydroxy-6-metoxy-1,4-benzoquinol methylase/uncharacterized protein YbaR (Trm112 family)
MLKSSLDIMCCPDCKGSLELESFKNQVGRVKDGLLTCKVCGTCYIICDYIPRMVPENLYDNHEFCENYPINTNALLKKWSDVQIEILDIQNHTESNFGYEWEHYSKLGWIDVTGIDDSSTDESIRWFHEKLLLNEKDIKNKLVLDAGCGNGRYSRIASAYGANIISMDITRAVEVAFKNMNSERRLAQVYQADILHLPFKPESFDVVFTIGVIQHTGAPLTAVEHLAELVKSNGLLSVRTYRKGNSRLEENDAAIRSETIKFTLDELHEFSNIMSDLTNFLLKKGLFAAAGKHINIFPKKYDIFDWYAAPVAAKLTYDELRQVFERCGITPIRDLDDKTDAEQRAFGAISIVGTKDK